MTRGRPEKRIPAVAKAIGASEVHVSGDYSPFGRRRDDAVRDALGDVPLEATGSPYLVSPGPGHQGRRHAVQGVHAVLQRVAATRLAGAGQVGPEIGALDRPGRRSPAASTSPTPGSNSSCRPARRRPASSGRSSSTTASTTTPTTATGPTWTPPAGCRRT